MLDTRLDPVPFLDLAVELAREAGAILLRHHESMRPEDVDRKGPIDLVSVADREAEAHIKNRLRSAFPDHLVVAEESQQEVDGMLPARPRWSDAKYGTEDRHR